MCFNYKRGKYKKLMRYLIVVSKSEREFDETVPDKYDAVATVEVIFFFSSM